jgi:hypothetical protein
VSKYLEGAKARGLFAALSSCKTAAVVERLLRELPIVPENEWHAYLENPTELWRPDHLHWVPVGGDRGNAGRIAVGSNPVFPLGERTVNAMEALIELERQRELKNAPATLPPASPREAASRYFGLPVLDQIPVMEKIKKSETYKRARDLARKVRIRLARELGDYTVTVEDDGIGISPDNAHNTILSMGNSDKGDKPYLIGVFGQGGSSAFQGSKYSIVMCRRHPEFLAGRSADIGWTVVKQVLLKGRRGSYWAYLAATPDGRVPSLKVDSEQSFANGVRIAHIGYDFGKMDPVRSLYQSLNHLIFSPVVPYELYTKPDRNPEPMFGNGYRLSRLSFAKDKDLDKVFEPQIVHAE